eukprot:6180447-Pleurochrysis_carterae.AAC.1
MRSWRFASAEALKQGTSLEGDRLAAAHASLVDAAWRVAVLPLAEPGARHAAAADSATAVDSATAAVDSATAEAGQT